MHVGFMGSTLYKVELGRPPRNTFRRAGEIDQPVGQGKLARERLIFRITAYWSTKPLRGLFTGKTLTKASMGATPKPAPVLGACRLIDTVFLSLPSPLLSCLTCSAWLRSMRRTLQ